MLEMFSTVLANRRKDVEFSPRNALVNQDAANFHKAGAATNRAERKFLSSFPNFQLHARLESVTGTERLRKNDAPEFVEFESHRTEYGK